ncbi:MAG TPA: cardiolipin synthase [Fontimonas sp.]
MALLTAMLQGCTALPKPSDAPLPQIATALEGPGGAVPARKRAAILASLDGDGPGSDLLEKHLAYEQAIAGSPLVIGNRLTLLQNGPQTYEAMFTAIGRARHHINLETYIFENDEIGQQFAQRLLERQAAGVQVNLIYDSVGALATPRAFFDELRKAGIQIVEFNPVNPLADNAKTWKINNRDHRKLLVVDGSVAFVGGINISSVYSSSPSGSSGSASGDGWRDTHIRIEGPAVAEFQKLFIETWKRQDGKPFSLPESAYFPALEEKGDEIVRAIGSSPREANSPIYLTLLSAIAHAEKEILLTIAYFAPDPQLLDALTDAADRGVAVRLIFPSKSDSWQIFHLGRSYYAKLLRGGVQIYERQGAVMHAKTACIDGVWSTVGSTNLDWRSFLHNDEVNAIVISRDFARELRAVFAEDLDHSTEITRADWRRRSLGQRIQERLARIGAYWL